MPLSFAALQAAARDTTGEVLLALVTFTHPQMSGPLRVVVDHAPISSRSESYFPLMADIILQSSRPEDPGQASITLDAVDQSVIDAVGGLSGPITVDFEYILASLPDDVQVEQKGLQMRGIDVDVFQVRASLEHAAYLNDSAPWLRFTERDFPGLFPRANA